MQYTSGINVTFSITIKNFVSIYLSNYRERILDPKRFFFLFNVLLSLTRDV